MPLRSYDPTIARWNRIDPITHHGLSTYNAFGNNPVYYNDPSGGSHHEIREGRMVNSGDYRNDGRVSYNWNTGQYENSNGDAVGFGAALSSVGVSIDTNRNRGLSGISMLNRALAQYGLSASAHTKKKEKWVLSFGDTDQEFGEQWDNWDDNITVNKDGVITNVEKNNQPNRFFDEDGNELFFNDSNEVDQPYATAIFRRGERLFYYVSSEQINDEIINSGIIGQRYLSNVQITGPLFWASSWISAAIKGHSDFDFAEGYLINLSNEKIPSGNGLLSRNRASWADGTAFFRFGNTNNIYNLYDAGNYMWGRAMGISGFKYWEIRFGSRANELFFDSEADQRAIRRGFYNK